MQLFNKPFFLLVLLSLSLVFTPIFVHADSESDEDLDENDHEDAILTDESTEIDAQTTVEVESEDEVGVDSLSSPFAKTNILFIKPESSDLPAGKLARLLVSFQNNGTLPFLVEGIDGSLRFPQDFSYFIQNFTSFQFNKVVEAERESTFEFAFTPSETFSQRQFILVISLRYKNEDGKSFINSVFNKTITVVDSDEGFDGETFFLYVFLAGVAVLLVLAASHFLGIFKKKSKVSRFVGNVQKQANGVANGTTKDVDFEWIPKEHLQQNKSPRTSPRQRNKGTPVAGGNSSNDDQ